MPLTGSSAPEIKGEWITTEPEHDTILLDFWSLSCADCRKKLEVLKEIHGKFSEIEVVAVHTPSLEFEEDREQVREALEEHRVDFPVVHDPEKETWKRYGRGFGPKTVLVNDGKIEWQSTRETEGEELFEKLQELGEENVEVSGWPEHRSFEKYLGFNRCDGINNEGNFRGVKQLEVPKNRKLNKVYLDGKWRQTENTLEALEDARLFFYFDASELKMVADPDGVKRVKVSIDHGGVEKMRLGKPGLHDLASVEEGKHEVELRPEKGMKLYSLVFR